MWVRTDPFFTPVCSTPVASCSNERASVPSQCFLVGLLRVQIRPSLSRSFSSFKFAYQFIRAKGRLHSQNIARSSTIYFQLEVSSSVAGAS
jgi:hypothetical protein